MSVISGRVATEGDEIFYEVRGQGTPLLMIPGAFGDGWWYSFVADILSDEYKVITYDRRANARSTMNNPQNFEISQQSRDAAAVLQAANEESAYVFGNSSGAVIALEMAKNYPQAVRAVIAHEPPVTRLLPEARKLQRKFAGAYKSVFNFGRFGITLAMLRFAFATGLVTTGIINRKMLAAFKLAKVHREITAEPRLKSDDVLRFFFKQELLPVTNYLPYTELIKIYKVKVFMAVGKLTLDKKKWIAKSTQLLAEKLDCETILFPGTMFPILIFPMNGQLHCVVY